MKIEAAIAGAVLSLAAWGAAAGAVNVVECPKCDKRMRILPDGSGANINLSRLQDDCPDEATLAARIERMKARAAEYLRRGDVRATGDGLSPIMGWSSWNTFAVNISEDLILDTARAMATNGLAAAGYLYVNIDDGFYNGHGEDGKLRINTAKFPGGLKPVADGIHALGLRAGIYSDAGRNTCGSQYNNDAADLGSGLYGHDAADCAFYFNDCGFDFIKVDFCGGLVQHLDERERYTEIANAIRATGRDDVRFNICRWDYPGTWVADVAGSWRTTRDIRANWKSVRNLIDENLCLSAYASPGHYNDMDMLEVGHRVGQTKTDFAKHGDTGLTEEEESTHFGMWCMMSSPLLIGCDARTIPPETLALVTNPYLVAMNQNAGLGVQGCPVWREGDAAILVKDADERFGLKRYVALYNGGDEPRDFTVRARALDLGGEVQAFDLVEKADVGAFAGEVTVNVPPHGAKFYLFEADARLERERYDASAAFIPDYQELHDPLKAGTGYYKKVEGASCGVVATNCREIVWRDVWSKKGGEYKLEVRSETLGVEEIEVVVNGTAQEGGCLVLKPGVNEVRLRAKAEGDVLPDIDYIELRRAAKFIGAGAANGAKPALVVQEVVNEKEVERAEWRVTGLGVFTASVNGRPVGDSVLMPGYTNPKKRRHESTLDVTTQWNCAAGATNTLAALVTSGWWCDGIVGRQGGTWPAFRGTLLLVYKDGTRQEVVTDESWRVTTETPVVSAGIWEGEVYDARISPTNWTAVVVSDEFAGEVSPLVGAAVYYREDLVLGLNADHHFDLKPGVKKIIDFGQNCAAVPFLTVTAARGTKITIRLAEMLNDGIKGHHGDGEAGTLYTANMRGAKSAVEYICRGESGEWFCPTHTFYGYRYAEVAADGPAEGFVFSTPVSSVSKEMERGAVETGDARVNRLVKNAYWSMLSNYLSVPTDCPQRNERLGWTGDTQVFCKTASYFADVRGFFRKWMRDVRDTQHADGTVPYVVPCALFGDNGPIAGWSDAAIIVPYTMWKQLDDADVVRDNWDVMERYMARIAKDGYTSRRGEWLLCDWLSYERLSVDQSKRWGNGSYTDDHLSYQNFLNACYLYQDARMMAEMFGQIDDLRLTDLRLNCDNEPLGQSNRKSVNRQIVNDYASLAQGTKERILKTWFKEDGTLCELLDGMQTPALFALKLGLGDRSRLAARLVASIHANGDRLATGFLGTPLLCEVLSGIGETELAYTLLLQRAFPSWLYTVDQGATTMWERWDSYTKDRGFGDVRMNSFNHYAYGAVAGWLFEHAAGLRPDPSGDGWRNFVLAPEPDARLGHLKATYRTDYGVIESTWNYDADGVCHFRFVVPPGTTATVCLPDGTTFAAPPGTYTR